ncbi:calcium:sodium antiporter [Aureococcus anophagefferens]|nr:calcium:sodium antiporter [Aureococcus anophagefferens]
MFASLLAWPYIDPRTIVADDETRGAFQVATLVLLYGGVLSRGCACVNEGAELLLLTRYEDAVGAVLLPLLIAFPEAVLLCCSGARTRGGLDVGAGSLFGNTVFMLTVPWAIAVSSGAVGRRRPRGLRRPAVAARHCGAYLGAGEARRAGSRPRPCPTSAVDRFRNRSGFMAAIADVVDASTAEELERAAAELARRGAPLAPTAAARKRTFGGDAALRAILRPLFARRADALGKLAVGRAVFDDAGEPASEADVQRSFGPTPTDVLDFDGFVAGVRAYAGRLQARGRRRCGRGSAGSGQRASSASSLSTAGTADDEEAAAAPDAGDDGDDDDALSVCPDEFAEARFESLGAAAIAARAWAKLGLGVVLVVLASAPLPDCLEVLADRFGVSNFIAAFVFVPVCTQLSEVAAIRGFAAKRTPRSLAYLFEQLLGAAMRPLALGVLLAWPRARRRLTTSPRAVLSSRRPSPRCRAGAAPRRCGTRRRLRPLPAAAAVLGLRPRLEAVAAALA